MADKDAHSTSESQSAGEEVHRSSESHGASGEPERKATKIETTVRRFDVEGKLEAETITTQIAYLPDEKPWPGQYL